MSKTGKPPRIDERATITAHAEVAPGFRRMALAAPESARRFSPGQFFQLRVLDQGLRPLLRRPFAPSEIHADGFAFVYAVVGTGTETMARLPVGAAVQVLAPLGRGWALPRKGSRAVLVGGGCGTPSLRVLAETLALRGVAISTVIGARTACTLLERDALARLSELLAVSTDDGSAGFHGHAVGATEALLDEIGPTPRPHLFACGPTPMLRGLAALAHARGLPCQVSLEERMACGFGACMGCVVAIRADNPDGIVYRRVCVDGPVFDAEEVRW